MCSASAGLYVSAAAGHQQRSGLRHIPLPSPDFPRIRAGQYMSAPSVSAVPRILMGPIHPQSPTLVEICPHSSAHHTEIGLYFYSPFCTN